LQKVCGKRNFNMKRKHIFLLVSSGTLPFVFGEIRKKVTVEASQIGSGVALVPAQMGTIILVVFFVALYSAHKHIKKITV